jgi:hypothetical protein
MVRTLGLALAGLLFLSVQFASPASAQADWPICGPNAHKLTATERLWSQFYHLTQAEQPPLAGNTDGDVPVPRSRPADAPQPPCDIDNGETRLSYPGFEHCRLHRYYQQVFPQVGCSCTIGQCRPTEWRNVPVTAENPEGVQIKVSGEWYDVPPEVLHRFYATGPKTLPAPLLEYDAHVCASESKTYDPVWKIMKTNKPTFECVWIESGI